MVNVPLKRMNTLKLFHFLNSVTHFAKGGKLSPIAKCVTSLFELLAPFSEILYSSL